MDNFGPITIPQAGLTVDFRKIDLEIYYPTIRDFEGLSSVDSIDNTLLIAGVRHNEYTFKQDYYFIVGDNRPNSKDSRDFGFLPNSHVIGKVLN
jgi:signal peptidase I